MQFTPFHPAHLRTLVEHPAMRSYQGVIDAGEYRRWNSGRNLAWTALDNGHVAACFGVVADEKIAAAGHCWAIVHPRIRRRMVSLHREVSRLLQRSSFMLLAAIVDRRCDDAARWLAMLGFTPWLQVDRGDVPCEMYVMGGR